MTQQEKEQVRKIAQAMIASANTLNGCFDLDKHEGAPEKHFDNCLASSYYTLRECVNELKHILQSASQ